MSNDELRHEAPTRRDAIRYGGAVIGGGLLAGCAGDANQEATPTDTSTQTDTNTARPTTEKSAQMV